MLGEINRRTRINFLPIPYISKVWISWNFHPFHLFTSRHDIHGSLVLLSFWSHSIRLQSVPPSPSPTSENFLGDGKGGFDWKPPTPPTPSFWSSLFYDMPPMCAQFLLFTRFSLFFPSIFLRSSRSKRARSFSKTVDRLLRFFLSRYKVKKKRNSIRLARFPLILFLVLEDGYGYQCTDTLMEDRRFSSRSKINFFLEFLRSNSKWR